MLFIGWFGLIWFWVGSGEAYGFSPVLASAQPLPEIEGGARFLGLIVGVDRATAAGSPRIMVAC